MKIEGSATVEAALIFPVVFLLCMAYLQFALYFTAEEYAQGLCSAGILTGADTSLSDGEIENALSDRGMGIPGLSGSLSVTSSQFLMFRAINTAYSGTYSLLSSMDLQIHSKGYDVKAPDFLRSVDLIWQLSDSIEPVKRIKEQWFGG